MTWRRPLAGLLLACVLAGSSAVTVSACATAPPNLTPQGRVAYHIEDLVDALGVIQHAAINASHAGIVTRPVALKVTRAIRAMAKTLDAAVDAGTGTAAIYRDVSVGLEQLASDSDLTRFLPEINAARAIVSALAGGV